MFFVKAHFRVHESRSAGRATEERSDELVSEANNPFGITHKNKPPEMISEGW
jgi:hypothetical protein